ncbi:MAG TPA: hypothetical protein VKU02_14870 [Gemmataceae bacterium]|nr:hypothetical protein [Gemmataceae bacterium]
MASGNPNVAGPGPTRDVDAAWGCGWAWLWFWLFLFVIIIAGWGWGGWYGGWGAPWGWWGPRPVSPPQVTAPPNLHAPATPASGEFLGKTVIVNGQVDQILNPQVFTLAGSQGGRQLLIINKNGTAPTLKKGESVQVTGTVEKYDTDELRKQTGVDLTKVPSADFAGRPAVVASSVSTRSSPG